jgi:hypothetical protein
MQLWLQESSRPSDEIVAVDKSFSFAKAKV